MNPVEAVPILPRSDLVEELKLALHLGLSRFASRVNRIVPKDGSELTDMVAFSSITTPVYTSNPTVIEIGKGTGFVRLQPGAANRITYGMSDPTSNEAQGGRYITLLNIATNRVFSLIHESVMAPAEQRFSFLNGTNYTMLKSSSIELWYDTTVSRWKMSK